MIRLLLTDVKKALLSVSDKVYHYTASGATGNYIVWAEDGQNDELCGDGAVQTQNIEGTIDYYTKKEYDPAINTIQKALNQAGIAFRVNSIQREADTGYIHYEWVFSLPVEVSDGDL